MLRRTLVAAGCAAVLASGVAGPARSSARAAGACPDPRAALLAFNASRAWSVAGTKGIGVTIGVVGAPDRVDEAVCAVRALAPEATVRAGSANGAIVVLADPSVDPASIGGDALLIAAAGDTSGPMPDRPAGIVNVAAADASGAPLSTSSYGPKVTVAAYGNDTATASGYVAALAAVLRAAHGNWPARQVVAQEAGSINPVSGYPHTDQLGFGIIQPVQAVSLPPVDPAELPGFEAMFPPNQGPRAGAPSPRSSPPGSSVPASSAAPSASASDGSAGTPAPGSGSDTAPSSAPLTGTTDSAQQWPTGALPTSGGPPNAAQAGAGKSDGGGGVSPVLFIGLLVLVGGGGYVLWQRRRQVAAAAPVKPEAEWEAPSGPRHSGYSTPEE